MGKIGRNDASVCERKEKREEEVREGGSEGGKNV